MFDQWVRETRQLIEAFGADGHDGGLAILLAGAVLIVLFLLLIIPVGWVLQRRRSVRLQILGEMAWAAGRNFPIDTALAPLAIEAGRWGLLDRLLFSWPALIEDVQSRVTSGMLLADACWPHRRFFGAARLSFLREAERAGRLDRALQATAEQLREEERTRYEAKETLLYPIYLFGVAVAVTYFGMGALVFVMSMMGRVLSDMGIQTVWFYAYLTGQIEARPPIGLLGVVVLLCFVWMWIREGRERHPGWSFHVPGIGGVMRLHAARNFCDLLAVVAGAGMPLPAALRHVAGCARFVPYRRLAARLAEGLERGGDPAACVSRERLIPPMARELLVLGLRSGDVVSGCRFAGGNLADAIRFRRRVIRFLLGAAAVVAAGAVVLFVCMVVFGALTQIVWTMIP